MEELKVGATFTKEITVTEQLLALTVGSGDVKVYATPMMICLMEDVSASCLKQFIEADMTSVGTMISSSHVSATPVGMKVNAKATVTAIEGKQVCFAVEAFDEKGLIGKGTHERFILNREKFEAKTNEKLN